VGGISPHIDSPDEVPGANLSVFGKRPPSNPP
jgi:hypothetical protein